MNNNVSYECTALDINKTTFQYREDHWYTKQQALYRRTNDEQFGHKQPSHMCISSFALSAPVFLIGLYELDQDTPEM